MERALTRSLIVAVLLAAALIYATVITTVLVVVFSGIIIAVALNPPVTWLERRHVPRAVGTLCIIGGVALGASVVFWFIGATLLGQVDSLVTSAPGWANDLARRADHLFASYPALHDAIQPTHGGSTTRAVTPSLGTIVSAIGAASIGLATLLLLGITWLTIVVFLTIEPRSALRMLLRVAPESERAAVHRVVVDFSAIVQGWLWANVFVGVVQAVAVASFLSWLNIPAALVWGLLAFFTTFIPKVGAFLAAAAPVLVALAVHPSDIFWIAVFYVALTEVTSDVLLPRIQGHAMRLHPVYIVAFLLVFGSAFGLLGAILATPLAGLVGAVWQEFVVSRRPPVAQLDERVEQMLDGVSPAGRGEVRPQGTAQPLP
jgi:predicted PurR-regulated permease PerM